ncbi:MAG: hypothetical protein AAF591_16375 [Verrucomicrobiota bacterium]
MMKVKVLVFSVLRDIVGVEEMEREVVEGATVGDLLEGMIAEWPKLKDWEGRLLLAVDLAEILLTQCASGEGGPTLLHKDCFLK